MGAPIANFHETREYNALTPQQKVWVDVFISTRDKFRATREAYHFANELHAKKYSYVLLKKCLGVRAALDAALKTNREMLLEEVIQNIACAERGSVAMQRFLAQKERLMLCSGSAADEKPKAAAPSPVVDSRVPAGCTALADDAGVIRGYRLPNGTAVRLADVEVLR